MISSENRRRVITAAIALPLFYLYITKLPSIFFMLLLVSVSALAQIEFNSMYKTKRFMSFLGILSGILLLISSLLSLTFTGIAFMFLLMLMTSARLFSIKDPSSSLKDISPAVIGFLYIPNLLLSQWHLMLKGSEWILFLYGCVWASDSLAYYIGKGIGKRKLYREISPNKTVEGAFGSVAGGILAALLLGSLLDIDKEIYHFILIGGVIGTVTIVGDLVESMFKRDAGVKDSGSIIPGHGGILDKIDGVLFAGPVLYLITLMLN